MQLLLFISEIYNKRGWVNGLGYRADEKLRTAEDIIEKLDILDFLCIKKGVVAKLVILGGAGILLMLEMNDAKFRPTRDIDVNVLAASDEKEILRLLAEANIDTVGGVMELPPMEDFKEEESLHELGLEYENIRVYLPSIELLACCKIFSKRQKDLNDLTDTLLLDKCNKEILLEMVEDYKENLLNPSDPDINVHQLAHIFEQKGI